VLVCWQFSNGVAKCESPDICVCECERESERMRRERQTKSVYVGVLSIVNWRC